MALSIVSTYNMSALLYGAAAVVLHVVNYNATAQLEYHNHIFTKVSNNAVIRACVIVRYPRASRKRIQLSWRCNALDGAPSDSLIQSMLLDPWSKCCVLLRSVLGRERARS